MKVIIDQDLCIECGNCQEECGEVFQLVDGEKATIVDNYRTNSETEGEISSELMDCVQHASETCPTDAIITE